MDPYLFAFGGILLGALVMGAGTFLIIKLDRPRKPKRIDG